MLFLHNNFFDKHTVICGFMKDMNEIRAVRESRSFVKRKGLRLSFTHPTRDTCKPPRVNLGTQEEMEIQEGRRYLL